MKLEKLTLNGFKSFSDSVELKFPNKIVSIVGPNGSGKSNVVEAFRFVLGEQKLGMLRGKKGSDFIFKGIMKSNNFASVEAVFNNSDDFLDIDFEKVAVKRIVHRDGNNEYFINGTQVRLQDVVKLFVKANIGSTGHHIISQGQADRLLSSNIEERKEMIEDSLGLKFLQYKKQETKKKITKTEENLKEVSISLRELKPQLIFLEKQVKQIKKADEIKINLTKLYEKYLFTESIYLTEGLAITKAEKEELNKKLEDINLVIDKEKNKSNSNSLTEITEEMKSINLELEKITKEKVILERSVGKVEGEMFVNSRSANSNVVDSVKREELSMIYKDLDNKINSSDLNENTSLLNIVSWVKNALKKLLDNQADENIGTNTKDLEATFEKLTRNKADLEKKECTLRGRYNDLSQQQIDDVKATKNYEKTLYDVLVKKTTIEKKLFKAQTQIDSFVRLESEFSIQLNEGNVLIGERIDDYKKRNITTESIRDIMEEKRDKQYIRRKELEKEKLKLEHLGTSDGEAIKNEYDVVKERNDLLENESKDLTETIKKIEIQIIELNKEIKTIFSGGIKNINNQFNEFFKLMFGGGSASLKLAEGKKKDKMGEVVMFEGVDIKVQLPRKNISSLNQLSGGERALTSIALLFAMSQVTPPPFLILDETDSALDEANSKRYGDMIEKLSAKSQLILVTHNRETMSRAGVIYGITIGKTGGSRTLSINLEEAVKVAK